MIVNSRTVRGIFLFLLFFNILHSEAIPDDAIAKDSLKKEKSLSDFLHISVFMQSQFYMENHGAGNIHIITHEDGFRIRRLRPQIDGSITPEIRYKIQPVFFSDFQTYVPGMDNAHIEFVPSSVLAFTLGRFTQPFGSELSEDSSLQVFPEKSRYWSYLFSQQYNNGLAVCFSSGIFRWHSAFFYSFTDGYSVVREQDFVSRLTAETEHWSSGLGFFTNQKKFSGSELPSDIKGNLFVTWSPKNWKISLEATAYLNDYKSIQNLGEGGHLLVEHDFLNYWKLGNRVSILSLERDLSANEIGINSVVYDSAPHLFLDYMLTLAWYFTNQDNNSVNKSHLSITYNPSYFFSGEIAHAFFLQSVILF